MLLQCHACSWGCCGGAKAACTITLRKKDLICVSNVQVNISVGTKSYFLFARSIASMTPCRYLPGFHLAGFLKCLEMEMCNGDSRLLESLLAGFILN